MSEFDEHDWRSLGIIKLLACLAALFHDLGKANAFFQSKLRQGKILSDPYRHEWVSLRLFHAYVGEANSDLEWLKRLAEMPEEPDMAWAEGLIADRPTSQFASPFKKMKLPLARSIGWLIVSHHRLPRKHPWDAVSLNQRALRQLPNGIEADWTAEKPHPDIKDSELERCWRFDAPLPFASAAWRSKVRKVAGELLELHQRQDNTFSVDFFSLHASRLVLTIADHYYSSLDGEGDRVRGDAAYDAYANSLRVAAKPRLHQKLDEHLLGVAKACSSVARLLPRLEKSLPRLGHHSGLKKRCADPRFRWQDKAFEMACGLRGQAAAQGFFGLNLASTGCGKTLGNGRIMYGLADPELGARFTIALGLRTLTLQTGNEYRRRLGLNADDLAVLCGGGAVKELYQLGAEIDNESAERVIGSESADKAAVEEHYVHYEGSLEGTLLGKWLQGRPGSLALVNAPILACTIDHLMPSVEALRGGRQIAPMLRLLTSDLILDEPDDFDISDLYALSRLVHWAGMLGSRVLLSSATIPPPLAAGLFNAYSAGRALYRKNRGAQGTVDSICCAWFDEFGCASGEHMSDTSFGEQHAKWAQTRARKLDSAEVRRRAIIVDVMDGKNLSEEEATGVREDLAGRIATHTQELHQAHHSIDPVSKKRVSFGLVRMANIDPLIDVTRYLAGLPPPPGTRLHLCCYHSRHPLFMRSAIERRLDAVLDRHDPERVFSLPDIRALLDGQAGEDHLFIILATPVAEVGRDHDYDWAIVEPSSMRSFIQLAGRVRRHRPGTCDTPNIRLLDRNLKSYRTEDGLSFVKPGFECKGFKLASVNLRDIVTPDQLIISAKHRIVELQDAVPRENLAAFELERIRMTMSEAGEFPASLWWTTSAPYSGELQRNTPFRLSPPTEPFVLLYNDEEEQLLFHRIEQDGSENCVETNLFGRTDCECAAGVDFWPFGVGESCERQVEELAQHLDMDKAACARRFGTLDLPENSDVRLWLYHPALGLRRG